MPDMFADRVQDSTTTTGTSDLTLSGTPPTGMQAFSTEFPLNSPFYYTISSSGSSEWEVGIGYLSGSTTLVRQRVLSSSNSNALVSLSAGTKDVFCSIPAKVANATEFRGRVEAMRLGACMP